MSNETKPEVLAIERDSLTDLLAQTRVALVGYFASRRGLITERLADEMFFVSTLLASVLEAKAAGENPAAENGLGGAK